MRSAKLKTKNKDRDSKKNNFCVVFLLAMYHLSVKYISRGQGRSAVGAAAYRSGEKLYNDYDGLTHDYTKKLGVAHTEIMLPENSPAQYFDRQKFWNAVEQAEANSTRKNTARTAREIEIALPLELDRDQQIQLVRNYVKDNFVTHGMGADIAIHDGKHHHKKDKKHQEAESDHDIKKDNPHAHILLTTRNVTPEGLEKKNRSWDKKANVSKWRKNWADIQNREFKRLGISARVDHRTLKEQGINRQPTIKEGVTARSIEANGKVSERMEENRRIRAENATTIKLNEEHRNMAEKRINQGDFRIFPNKHENGKSKNVDDRTLVGDATPTRTPLNDVANPYAEFSEPQRNSTVNSDNISHIEDKKGHKSQGKEQDSTKTAVRPYESPSLTTVPTRTRTNFRNGGTRTLSASIQKEDSKGRAKARKHINNIKQKAESERKMDEAKKAKTEREIREQQRRQEHEERRAERERRRKEENQRDRNQERGHDRDTPSRSR